MGSNPANLPSNAWGGVGSSNTSASSCSSCTTAPAGGCTATGSAAPAGFASSVPGTVGAWTCTLAVGGCFSTISAGVGAAIKSENRYHTIYML